MARKDSTSLSLRPLVTDAREGRKKRRLAAARDLAAFGPEALDPLFELLQDHDQEVSIAAAESLGAIGDERAIEPLTRALRGSFWGGSARANLWLGLALLVGLVLVGAALTLGVIFLKVAALWIIFHIWRIPKSIFDRRRRRSQFVRAVSEALMRIAEANPSPVLSSVVTDLRTVAMDKLQQEPETRKITGAAAERIESLVGQLRSLPVAADGPHQEPEAVLPRPASPPDPDLRMLPRISG